MCLMPCVSSAVHSVPACVHCSSMCTLFQHVHIVPACTQCSSMCTLFQCVYIVPACVHCSSMCTLFQHVHSVPACTHCSSMCTFQHCTVFQHVYIVPVCVCVQCTLIVLWFTVCVILLFPCQSAPSIVDPHRVSNRKPRQPTSPSPSTRRGTGTSRRSTVQRSVVSWTCVCVCVCVCVRGVCVLAHLCVVIPCGCLLTVIAYLFPLCSCPN